MIRLRLIPLLTVLICELYPGADARGQQVPQERGSKLRLKATLEELQPGTFEREAHATDRGVAAMNLSRLSVYTFNFGIQLGRIFTTGRGDFPNGEGTVRGFYFVSVPALAVGSGPWHSNPMVHENSDFHSTTKVDWEAMDGARGILFSDPPYGWGYPIFAVSDLPLTWPRTGWPAPESVQAVWCGTDTWYKWRRVQDRECFAIFDDKYADREGDGQSIPLGIDVRYRALCPAYHDVIFFQYEFTNSSSYSLTDVYLGQIVDAGSPTRNSWSGFLRYNRERQLIYSVGVGYDSLAGTHLKGPGSEEIVSWVGHMWMETPTGSFKTDSSEMLVDNPADILTRVAFLDWDDRILYSESSLYGAMSGNVSLMESIEAEHVWKLSQGGGAPVLIQDEYNYKAYNANWASSADNFYYVSSGPVSMAPGESLDYILAMVGGFTEQEMLETADVATSLFQHQMQVPPLPKPPGRLKANGVRAGPHGREYDPRLHPYEIYYTPSGDITLTWGVSESETTPNYLTGLIDFEGYRVYRSIDRGETWGTPVTDELGNRVRWVPVVQFDLENGITGRDPETNTYLGDDTGIQHSWSDPDVMDGVEYWYAITAYDRGGALYGTTIVPSQESALGSHPSEPNVIAVIAGSRPNGYINGMVEGGESATLEPTVSPFPGFDGSVRVNVVMESEILDCTYRITTADSGSYGTADSTGVIGVTLERISPTAATLYTALMPDHGYFGWNLLPVVDGIQVEMETLWNTGDYGYPWEGYPDYYEPREEYTFLGAEGFYSSGLERSLENFGNVFFDAEIRFSTTMTQQAYVMARDSTDWNGTGNFLAYNEFPGTIWDVSSEPERQVNIVYTMEAADTTNGYDFDIGFPWDAADNCHYMRILSSDYSGATPDTVYTSEPGRFGSRSCFTGTLIDGVWLFVPALSEFNGSGSTTTVNDLDGTVARYGFSHPIGPGWQYEFSTTAAAIDEAHIDLDDIRVVPNPYFVYATWDQGDYRRKIQFTNVPADSEIWIYTLTGELVAILDHHGDATAVAGGRGYNSNRIGTVDWNLWSYEFTEVSYGLYLYIVKTDDGRRKVGKFAIIR